MLFLILWSAALIAMTVLFIRQEQARLATVKLFAVVICSFGVALTALALAASRVTLLLDEYSLTIRRRSLIHGFGTEIWRRGELASWRIRNAGASGGALGLQMLRSIDLRSHSGRVATLPYRPEVLRGLEWLRTPATFAAAVCPECRTPFGPEACDADARRFSCRSCGGEFAAARIDWVALEFLESSSNPGTPPIPGCRFAGGRLRCRIPRDWDFWKLTVAVFVLSGFGIPMLIAGRLNSPPPRGIELVVVSAALLFLVFLPGWRLHRFCRRLEFAFDDDLLTMTDRGCFHRLKQRIELGEISRFEVEVVPHRGGADRFVLVAVRRDGGGVKLAGGFPEATLRFAATVLNRHGKNRISGEISAHQRGRGVAN